MGFMHESVAAPAFSGLAEGPNTFDVPHEVLKKINWGALMLSWIWAIWNAPMKERLLSFFIPFYFVLLALKGNQVTLAYRKYDSLDHFLAVQKAWTKWGLIVVVGVPVVLIALSIILSIVIGASASHAS